MKTDSQIIDELGGTSAVAELCQVSAPSVSEWRHTGIPKARRMYLQLLHPDVFQVCGQAQRHPNQEVRAAA